MRAPARRLYTQILTALFLVTLLISPLTKAHAQTPETSPVGTWQTIDDETNKPRSIVQIYENNGLLEARIVKIYFRAGEKATDVCDKCTDSAHKDQPILGMVFMWGMKKLHDTDDNQWGDGQILDPHNGEIYHCQLRLSPNGETLTVRGYIGVPLIGRSQSWRRVSEE